MTNEEFLEKVKESFYKYLETGSRSNEKLKILHGAIASDISKRLGESYKIHSLGYEKGKEINMTGKYMDKKVDIGIAKENEVIAAVALKFIMRNYSQNSNNYFENMLGETANIRSNGKPYFQILILPSKVPYFKTDGTISKIETITEHNIAKYLTLSNDNVDYSMHTPNKTLLCLIDIPDFPKEIQNIDEYKQHYLNHSKFKIVENAHQYQFGNATVYNNYNEFVDKICYYIKSI